MVSDLDSCYALGNNQPEIRRQLHDIIDALRDTIPDRLQLTGSDTRDLGKLEKWSMRCVFSKADPGESVVTCDKFNCGITEPDM